MQRLVRTATWLCAVIFLSLALPALAADRSISLLPDTDIPGFDYSRIEGTDLDTCKAACVDDKLCRAITFNEEAEWCFLKSEAGAQSPFEGATSGVIESDPSFEAIAADRSGDLPFAAFDLISSAQYFAVSLPNTDPPPEGVSYESLVEAGDEAAAQPNPAAASVSYRQALAINDNDPELWLKLARVTIDRAQAELEAGNGTYDLGSTAVYSALNAYLQLEANETAVRAESLALLARSLEFREMWRESIVTYRASLALVDDARLQARLDTVVAEHGFRVVSHQVDAEAASPRICAVFSDPLPGGGTDLSGYVVVEGAPQVAVETESNQICITGVEHGSRYHVRLRSGLPSQDGEQLRADVDLDIYVPDRTPFVGFANNAYVMPAGLGGGLPITSVNAESADVVIYRIGDRSIATAVRNGIFQQSLSGYSAEDVAYSYGEKVFEGVVELARSEPNAMSVTAIPVGEVLTGMDPGAYVITAKVTDGDQEYWREMATQWFVVTDLGLTAVNGDDGVHAFVRSLTTAQPVANADVRLVARNNEILGEGKTDADGRAVFAPGLARGEAGRAPQLIVAETSEGDYAFLDVSKSAFDLTDRGVDGRPSPGPLDLFATTERGVYRPGETVFVTAILRDELANAVADLPLTLEIQRPDGVIASTEIINDQGAGGYFASLPLAGNAMRGSWSIRLYADPRAASLASVSFLVEDFEPERLAFEISTDPGPIATDEPTEVNVAAKYLYGATAPGLTVEADAVLRPVRGLVSQPGYTFGREDDTFQTYREFLGTVGITDEAGNAVAELTIPSSQSTTRPLEAQLILRLIDSNGRPVERTLNRSVLATTDRVGVKPGWDESDGLGEGSNASFDVVTVAPDGALVAKSGLTWRLSRIETNYQWYRSGDTWRWEAITTTREVANGTVDTSADGPASVSAPVDWGRYLFEIETDGEGAHATSYGFYAGYYYPEAGSDTPDTLSVALDKDAYKTGDTASLQLEPQFAGTALVMVLDNRVIDMMAVEVPAEGTSVAIPVTEAWGPGAYVTAILYRPADATEKRMPARALGLAYADVDPGDRVLDIALEAPEVALPRQAFTTTVTLANVTPGETAYVAVAAVDLGILNLTNFAVPDPDGWFFGQRMLGVELRDLYGQLIDPTQGMPGALRAGGDGSGGRGGTPPATSVLVALHSGIVTVGEDGTASVSFDMPDFNGTVRLMAMAWSANAVGHASKDVVVRDPVVVNLSPPRFLRLDDTSRLLVEINNVDGPAGTYKVELLTEDGLETDAPETSVEIDAGGRASLDLGLTGTAIGDNKLRLIVTGPTGQALVKELTLGVRAASAPQTSSRLLTIEPGESLSIDASYFDGMLEQTGSLTLAVGPIARLDVPNLLLSLDRYPYGCAEQTSSRALPLLYLNEVATAIGMGEDGALDERVRDAIADLLSKQNSGGGFGLWGPFDGGDLWLDAYVTEFLIRAGEEGYEVPAQAVQRALDNLSNQVSYASDFELGGEGLAYALYDLARAGRAAIGDLRYYLEAKLSNFATPLAKAHLGAALALYGDRTRAATAFAAAIEGLGVREEPYAYRADYGSQLRDTAAVLALAVEAGAAGVDVSALTSRLTALRDAKRWTSTQEDAWTLMAAAALARDAGDGSVSIDGEALQGTVYRRYDQTHLEGAAVEIVNSGNAAAEVKVSVTGIPAEPPAASSEGFAITREYFLPDGTPVEDMSAAAQNERFVVKLTMVARTLGSGQYVVADPLPAGFEIENPNLAASGGVGDLGWLAVDTPTHTEARTDQYVAAFRYVSEYLTFSTAYMVRAVSPGTFVLPGATVEDMYRPELRGNTDADAIEISSNAP